MKDVVETKKCCVKHAGKIPNVRCTRFLLNDPYMDASKSLELAGITSNDIYTLDKKDNQCYYCRETKGILKNSFKKPLQKSKSSVTFSHKDRTCSQEKSRDKLFNIDHYLKTTKSRPDKQRSSSLTDKDRNNNNNNNSAVSILNGAKINSLTLHEASKLGDQNSIETLLMNNANTWVEDERGYLPIDVATTYPSARMLLEATVFYAKKHTKDSNLFISRKLVFEL